ncbi:MAG: aminotransferase class III-fold pyridoxal phosphate-dependent enzyme, partial [Thermoleophilia bacterium]
MENTTLIVRDFKQKYRMIDRAEGIYVYDTDGKRYIDGTSGSAAVSSIGHGVPEVVNAIHTQLQKYAYSPGHYFANEPARELADLLASITPQGLNQVWLVCDGTEATEAAVKFARQYHQEAGRPTKSLVISRWQSYHGATIAALGYGGHTYRRRKFYPMYENTPHVPAAYCYRCYFGQKYPQCGIRCAQALDQEIQQQGPQNVAAFIAEPLVGAALGAVAPVKEYFPMIREICDRHEVLLIADEVMTGFGRTGEMFAMQHWNVKPDIMTCAKAISGGYVPLGAAVLDEKIIALMKRKDSNVISGHTYGSHHVMA